jgi:hypothetical protein
VQERQILKEVGVQAFRDQQVVRLVEGLEDFDPKVDAALGELRPRMVENLGVRNGRRTDPQRSQATSRNGAHRTQRARRLHSHCIAPRLLTSATNATRRVAAIVSNCGAV